MHNLEKWGHYWLPFSSLIWILTLDENIFSKITRILGVLQSILTFCWKTLPENEKQRNRFASFRKMLVNNVYFWPVINCICFICNHWDKTFVVTWTAALLCSRYICSCSMYLVFPITININHRNSSSLLLGKRTSSYHKSKEFSVPLYTNSGTPTITGT